MTEKISQIKYLSKIRGEFIYFLKFSTIELKTDKLTNNTLHTTNLNVSKAHIAS